ncbi:hypothetical protein ACFQ1S_00110 [Kibdelosporangium lantanae]|uniref:Uncharacterized protein n=1 Tax=Kibdelosporangium lantanae TaxID=1497396 RepID=A0ABW3M409_9PSEU
MAGLRAAHRRHYNKWIDQLKAEGCKALGYRLTGDIVDRLCVRHLRANIRVIVAFETPELAWILLIGPHDNSDPGIDIYTIIYQALDTPIPSEKRIKPPCCDGTDQLPPGWGDHIDELIDSIVAFTRSRRRR